MWILCSYGCSGRLHKYFLKIEIPTFNKNKPGECLYILNILTWQCNSLRSTTHH